MHFQMHLESCLNVQLYLARNQAKMNLNEYLFLICAKGVLLKRISFHTHGYKIRQCIGNRGPLWKITEQGGRY